jgi:CDP-diacylglycerol---serine O-phosphatidyltransferase
MTIAHGLCGFVAVAILAGRWQGDGEAKGVTITDLRLVGTLIAAGAVLDVLDGPVARRFGSSGMGDRLDGICDTITFGLTPAVLVVASGRYEAGLPFSALVVAGGLYLVAMILRLVRSELTSPEEIKRGFQGLPSAPASGAAVAAVALYAAPVVTCLLVVVIAVLVVGSFYYPRQRGGLMPIMAGGPVIGLLGAWGVLPLEPAAIATMILAIVPSAAAAGAAWHHSDAHLESGSADVLIP